MTEPTTPCRYCDDRISYDVEGTWRHARTGNNRCGGDHGWTGTRALPAAKIAAMVDIINANTFSEADAAALDLIVRTRLEPPLPTEPGLYLDRGGEVWRLAATEPNSEPSWRHLADEDTVVESGTDPAAYAPFDLLRLEKAVAVDVLRAVENTWMPGQERLYSYDAKARVMEKFGLEAPL